MLSIFGHVSRWLNKRVCFLVLMVFVFASAIVLLVILGLSVGLFSSFVPSLTAPSQVAYQRSVAAESDDEFETVPNQLKQTPNEPIQGQILAYDNLKKVIIFWPRIIFYIQIIPYRLCHLSLLI